MRPYILLFLIITLPLVSGGSTIGTIEGYWKISYDITNTNPYTVFVAVPYYDIDFFSIPLKSSKDFTTANMPVIYFVNQDYGGIYTTLNGELGFWMPPYTTVKVHREGDLLYVLNTANTTQNKYRVAGPALVSNTVIFDEKEQMDLLYKKGVKVDNYRLYVRGKFLKSQDSDVVSMVIPAPLVLKNYNKFNKIVGKGDADIWVNSYNDYIKGHEKISYKKHPELYDAFNDDTLIPKMLTEPDDGSMNIKLFDVPAMVFTTTDNTPIEFSYIMYSYDTN
ncbi:hypothetical protein KKP91_00680 [Methanothermococcus sp. SCGC AD-155-M21]|nr:hypothetical protein [Methanothermococcus sp. SCGC AD-155-M21]